MGQCTSEETESSLALFRPEAVSAEESSIYWSGLGDHSGGSSWYAIGIVLIGAVAFLVVLARPYSDWVPASGVVVSKAGTGELRASRAGILARLLKREGDSVHAGDVVALVRPTDPASEDESISSALASSLTRRLQILDQLERDTRQRMLLDSSSADAARVMSSEVAAATDRAIAAQASIIERRRAVSGALRELLSRGFASKFALEESEQQVAAEQEQLAALSVQKAKAAQDVAEQVNGRARSNLNSSLDLARLQQERIQVEDELNKLRAQTELPVRARSTGTLSGLAVRTGESVGAGGLIGHVITPEPALEAELMVDGRTAGLVKVGDHVRLSLEPFPYQQFGWVDGRVTSVDLAPRDMNAEQNAVKSYFRVLVSISKTHVRAYGRQIPIKRGIGLTAQFKVRTQSIFRWLLDPLINSANGLSI